MKDFADFSRQVLKKGVGKEIEATSQGKLILQFPCRCVGNIKKPKEVRFAFLAQPSTILEGTDTAVFRI